MNKQIRNHGTSSSLAYVGGISVLIFGTAALADVYKVRPRDCLSGILQRLARQNHRKLALPIYGRSGLISKVMFLNPHITNPNYIASGTVIRVPDEITMMGPPAPAPEVIQTSASAPERSLNPLYWRAALSISSERMDLVEDIGGVETRTNGQTGFPRVGFETMLRLESNPGIPHWEFGLGASLSRNASLDGLAFPNAGTAALFAERRGIFISQSMQMSFRIGGRYEGLNQATPDRTGREYVVRNTETYWTSAGTCMEGPSGLNGQRLCAELSRSVASQSEAPAGAASVSGISGWRQALLLETPLPGKLRAQISAQAIQLSSPQTGVRLSGIGAGVGLKYDINGF